MNVIFCKSLVQATFIIPKFVLKMEFPIYFACTNVQWEMLPVEDTCGQSVCVCVCKNKYS
jgi:hypothetical protein